MIPKGDQHTTGRGRRAFNRSYPGPSAIGMDQRIAVFDIDGAVWQRKPHAAAGRSRAYRDAFVNTDRNPVNLRRRGGRARKDGQQKRIRKYVLG